MLQAVFWEFGEYVKLILICLIVLAGCAKSDHSDLRAPAGPKVNPLNDFQGLVIERSIFPQEFHEKFVTARGQLMHLEVGMHYSELETSRNIFLGSSATSDFYCNTRIETSFTVLEKNIYDFKLLRTRKITPVSNDVRCSFLERPLEKKTKNYKLPRWEKLFLLSVKNRNWAGADVIKLATYQGREVIIIQFSVVSAYSKNNGRSINGRGKGAWILDLNQPMLAPFVGKSRTVNISGLTKLMEESKTTFSGFRMVDISKIDMTDVVHKEGIGDFWGHIGASRSQDSVVAKP